MTVTGPPFRIPSDVMKALGGGDDLPLGHAVLSETLGTHTLVNGVGVISAEMVKEIGNGNAAAGRKVLTRFIAKVCQDRTKTRAA